jgi:predicted lipoprotein with Yx(FWY)xxD motif
MSTGVKMIHKYLSIRPTIFGGVLAFAMLSLAACSPVAIMMPQAGANDQSAMPDQSSSESLAEESIAGVNDAVSNPDVFDFGYYVRAPGYMAEESNAGVIDVAALPYVQTDNNPVLGDFLVDNRGMTLYMFTQDEPGKSNCTGGCLQVWPPVLSSSVPTLGEGVDPSLVGKATLPGGLAILTYNGMPLYYFSGDNHPGAVNGQGKNNAWFVVSPAGQPIGMQ